MNQSLAAYPKVHIWLSKVPDASLIFWVLKMMSTTVGETAADLLNVNAGLGLGITSIVMAILFIIALKFQLQAPTYISWRYWLTVVFVSVLGTLLTDNLTDHLNVPLAISTSVFSILLIATFIIWYTQEKTLSIHNIDTRKRELFYWSAILLTFALGTAAGDWVAESWQLGYLNSAYLFGVAILFSYLAYLFLNANAVACFWVAYVLTRPFGASCGDLLAQSQDQGGLGFGVVSTSIVFLLIIMGLVAYLSFVSVKNLALKVDDKYNASQLK